MTTSQRLTNNRFYEAYKILLHQKNDIKRFDHILKHTIFVEKIGNESKFGEIFKGHHMNDEDHNEISIKKIPLSLKDLQIYLLHQETNRDLIFKMKTIWKEIYALEICGQLVRAKKSINLPLHYFFVYSACNKHTKTISKNQPYLYCYNELADLDLKTWSSKERSYHEWSSCFLQIFFSLYVLQYYHGFLHNDLHWGNILVFEIPKGGFWTYTVQHHEYKINNEGFLFVLWDFGMVSYHHSLLKCGDGIKSCQDFLKILNTPKWVKKHYPKIHMPKGISDLCLFIRSQGFKNMNEILQTIIKKIATRGKEQCLENFLILDDII